MADGTMSVRKALNTIEAELATYDRNRSPSHSGGQITLAGEDVEALRIVFALADAAFEKRDA